MVNKRTVCKSKCFDSFLTYTEMQNLSVEVNFLMDFSLKSTTIEFNKEKIKVREELLS